MRKEFLVLPFLAACASSTPNAPTTPATTSSSVTAAPFVEAEVFGTSGAIAAVMPEAVTSFGAVRIGDEVFVAGGYHGEPHNYSREGQSKVLMKWSANGGWQRLADLPSAVQGHALVPFAGGLVLCGGNRIDNAAGEETVMTSLAECHRYDLASNRWEAIAPMPEPRSSIDAAVVGSRVFVVGGWNLQGGPSNAPFAQEMVAWDGTAWTAIAAPFQRRALSVVGTPNAVVAIGGFGPDRRPTSRVDVFDTQTNTWSTGPEYPGEPFGMAAVAVGEDVYASGSDGVVYTWRPGASAWTRVVTMLQPRFFHRLVAQNDGSLLALGGIGTMTTEGRARLVERIVPRPSSADRVGVVEIAFPGEARNRFGAYAADDSLWMLGGNTSEGQHDFQPENFDANVRRLHLPSLRWFPERPLSAGRQSMAFVKDGERLIFVGGFGHDEDAPRTFADAFVASEDGWVTVPNVLPVPRTQLGVAVHDGAFYVFGGLDYDQGRPQDDQFRHIAAVLRCPMTDGVVGACEEIAQLPETRRAFAGAMLGDRYVLMGGMHEGFETLDTCRAFDFTSRTFSDFPCPSQVRVSADLIVHGEKLVLAGGSSRTADGLSPNRSMEVFDPATNTWSTVIESLPVNTHQMRFVEHRGAILGVSTQETAHRARVVWVNVD